MRSLALAALAGLALVAPAWGALLPQHPQPVSVPWNADSTQLYALALADSIGLVSIVKPRALLYALPPYATASTNCIQHSVTHPRYTIQWTMPMYAAGLYGEPDSTDILDGRALTWQMAIATQAQAFCQWGPDSCWANWSECRRGAEPIIMDTGQALPGTRISRPDPPSAWEPYVILVRSGNAAGWSQWSKPIRLAP